MVNICIYAEGPSPEHNNKSAQTMSNSNKVRQEFNRILCEVGGRTDVQISLEITGGYRATMKRLEDKPESIDFVFCDSETEIDHKDRNAWFTTMLEDPKKGKVIKIPQERRDDVFFMIQAMESWFLKQPEAIVRWASSNGYTDKLPNSSIVNHAYIKGKNIEMLSDPKTKLKAMLKHQYSIERIKKDGTKKIKNAEYSEAKVAPEILRCIDVDDLLAKDLELQRFQDAIAKL